jgi:hypothetical protein
LLSVVLGVVFWVWLTFAKSDVLHKVSKTQATCNKINPKQHHLQCVLFFPSRSDRRLQNTDCKMTTQMAGAFCKKPLAVSDGCETRTLNGHTDLLGTSQGLCRLAFG